MQQKKGVKSAGRVDQSVRCKGLGRVAKYPDSTNKLSKNNLDIIKCLEKFKLYTSINIMFQNSFAEEERYTFA